MSAVAPIGFAFDATNIDPFVGGGGKAIPDGQYPMYVSGMECKENNGKNGHHLALEYTVAEGEFKGTKVWDQLNLWHAASQSAVEIAQKKLSAVCHAVGKIVVGDVTELLNLVHLVTVDLQPETPETINPNTGEKVKGRAARNNVLRNDPPGAAKAPANFGGSPIPGAPASPMAQQAPAQAAQAPAQAAAQQAPAQPAQSAPPPFTQGQQAAAPAAAPAQAAPAQAAPAAGAVPPWQR